MSTPLPPDPYIALGVAKDATAAQIKTTYRKLVLKCHPDKVTDESKKAEASDQFHRIQQAYEILGDEGRRSRYDAQVKLAELRKQAMNNRPEVKTAAYEVPTSSPGRPTFTARGPERVYEERRPERSDSDDYFGSTRTTSRKHEDYERQPIRKATPRDDKERFRVFEREKKESEKVLRSDKQRTRDQETRRDREHKYPAYDVDSDTELRQEAERQRRRKANEEAAREKEARERARARAEREYREERGRGRDGYEEERERSSRRGHDKVTQHYSQLQDASLAYMGRDKRPSLSRSASTATKTETYVDRSSSRPTAAFVRRRSTKPRQPSPQPKRERERKMSVSDIPEVQDRRPMARPSTLYTSASSPTTIKLPRGDRAQPMRSASTQIDERHFRDAPTPVRRSETMPDISSSRRPRESKPSNLRETQFTGGIPTPSASPDYEPEPSPVSYKQYRYQPREASREDVDYRRPADRDYDRERRYQRSPEPMRQSKPSTTAATPRYTVPQPPPIETTNYAYKPNYMAESPTSYTSTRPSPVRRDTRDQRDYDTLPKVTTPKANSSARYEYPFERPVADNLREYEKDRRRGSPIEIDTGSRKAPPLKAEDVRMASGYSSRRQQAPASSRPHLQRQRTSEYYAPRTQAV